MKIKIVNKNKFITSIILTIIGITNIIMLSYFSFLGFCYFITTL